MKMENVVRGWAGRMREDSRKEAIMTVFMTGVYGAGVVAMIIIMAMK